MSGKAADIAAVFFLVFLLAVTYFFVIKPEEKQGMDFYSESTLDIDDRPDTDNRTDTGTKADIEDKEGMDDNINKEDKIVIDGKTAIEDKTAIDDNITAVIPVNGEHYDIPEKQSDIPQRRPDIQEKQPGIPEKQPASDSGNEGSATAAPGKRESPEHMEHEMPAEAQALCILKELYSYSEKLEDYAGAMDLLTDDFIMELDMFERFGVERIDKSDVTGDRIQAFARVLMSSSLKDIIGTKNEEDRIVIEYLHAMSLDDSLIELKLAADLVNDSGVWKIACIREIHGGNVEKAGDEPASEPLNS